VPEAQLVEAGIPLRSSERCRRTANAPVGNPPLDSRDAIRNMSEIEFTLGATERWRRVRTAGGPPAGDPTARWFESRMGRDGPTRWAMDSGVVSRSSRCARCPPPSSARLADGHARRGCTRQKGVARESTRGHRRRPRSRRRAIAGANVARHRAWRCTISRTARGESLRLRRAYRLRVQRPRATRRDELISHVGVAHGAPPADRIRSSRAPDGNVRAPTEAARLTR
jgi:hypothetical protein